MSKRSVTFFNLWVLLLGLFNFQPQPEVSWHALMPKNVLAQAEEIDYNPDVIDEANAAELDKLNILHPVPENLQFQDEPASLRSLNHCKSLVYKALQSLPQNVSGQLKHLSLHFSKEGRRGLAGGSTMIIRCEPLLDETNPAGIGTGSQTQRQLQKNIETVSVVTHESGHILDTGYLQGHESSGESEFYDSNEPIYRDDLSLQFYRLSFENEKKRRSDSSELDFVTGYAMSDPFEDFAETFDFYILHGQEFRKILNTSKVLKAKYDFLKIWIFEGKEFENGGNLYNLNDGIALTQRYYDATMLAYDLNEFFEQNLNKRDFVAKKDSTPFTRF